MSSVKRSQAPKTSRVVTDLPETLPILEAEIDLIGNFMLDVVSEILNSTPDDNQKRDYLLCKD